MKIDVHVSHDEESETWYGIVDSIKIPIKEGEVMSHLPVGAAVRYFMQLVGQDIPDDPRQLNPDEWKLRKSLMDEELKEMRDAWLDGDLPGFLDACVDLVYVTVGTAVAAGMPFDEAFDAVHRANMEKAPECEDCDGNGKLRDGWGPAQQAETRCGECAGKGRIVRFREDGKVLKPVGWKAPDIASIIGKATDAEDHLAQL